MDAPGGRDEGKELDPAVAHELEAQPRARVEGSAEAAIGGREPPRRDEPGEPRPAPGEEPAAASRRRTEPREGERGGEPTGVRDAPDAPGGAEHP